MKTSGTVGADLGGIFGADEDWSGGTFWSLEFGEVFGDEFGVIKTTSTNMAVDGGKGNDN